MEASQPVGRAFALLRKAKGMDREEVALALERSPQTVAEFETEDAYLSADDVGRALETIGCTWYELSVALRAVEAEAGLDEVTAGAGVEDLGWMTRQLLETQGKLAVIWRQHVALQAEFNRFRDAAALAWSTEVSEGLKAETAEAPDEPNGPGEKSSPDEPDSSEGEDDPTS